MRMADADADADASDTLSNIVTVNAAQKDANVANNTDTETTVIFTTTGGGSFSLVPLLLLLPYGSGVVGWVNLTISKIYSFLRSSHY